MEGDERNDVEFIRYIVSHVVKNVPEKTKNNNKNQVTIDTKRIYLTGHSNGCILAYAVTLKYPDLIAAMACFAGVLITPPSDTYQYQPTPIWMVHGKQDDVIPYKGRNNEEDEDRFFISQQQIYEYFSTLNGCNQTSDITFLLEEEVGEDGFYQKSTQCINNATVEFLTLNNTGHMPYLQADCVCDTAPKYDTTEDAWAFLSQHQSTIEPQLVDIRVTSKEKGGG